MTKLEEINDEVWDRFFDFVAQPVDDITPEDIQAELDRRGIDVSKAVATVNQAVASARARAALASAKEQRPLVVDRLTEIVAPPIERLREKLSASISDKLKGKHQLAYFRTLETAASEEDLQNLLNDLERLDALNDDNEAS